VLHYIVRKEKLNEGATFNVYIKESSTNITKLKIHIQKGPLFLLPFYGSTSERKRRQGICVEANGSFVSLAEPQCIAALLFLFLIKENPFIIKIKVQTKGLVLNFL